MYMELNLEVQKYWIVHCRMVRRIRTINLCLILYVFGLQTEADEAILNKKRSKSTQKKYDERKKTAKVENALDEQFASGRVLGRWL